MSVLRKLLAEGSSELFELFLNELETGKLRAAEKRDGRWEVNPLVKEAILLGFKLSGIKQETIGAELSFSDKALFWPKVSDYVSRGIRVVPGGSSVRRGVYLGDKVTIMPPAYLNVGAYVGEGTMVDSHALVGSCAQIGASCHISAGAQIGGVLEPVGALPVILEDNVFVGGCCGIFEGVLVSEGAVLAPGVILSASLTIYDAVEGKTIKQEDGVLKVPENAVVVPGSKALRGDFAHRHGVQIYAPVIMKYRDDKTDRALKAENVLRE